MEKFKKLSKEEMKNVLGGDEMGYDPGQGGCAADGESCLFQSCCNRCMGDAKCGTVH